MDDEDDGKVGSSQCVPSDVGDGQTVLMVAAALHWTLMISHPLHTSPFGSPPCPPLCPPPHPPPHPHILVHLLFHHCPFHLLVQI